MRLPFEGIRQSGVELLKAVLSIERQQLFLIRRFPKDNYPPLPDTAVAESAVLPAQAVPYLKYVHLHHYYHSSQAVQSDKPQDYMSDPAHLMCLPLKDSFLWYY